MHKKSTTNRKKSMLFTALVSTAIIISIFLLCVSSPTAQNVPDHIVISEVFYDESGTPDQNEFIELYNPTTHDISLTGWNISHYNQDGDYLWSIEFGGGTIAAHDYYLIGQQDPIVSGDWTGTPKNTDATFLPGDTLENGPDDYIVLRNNKGGYIDGVRWGHNPANTPPAIQDVPTASDVAPDAEPSNSIERRTLVQGYSNWARCQDTDNNADDFLEKDTPSPTSSSNIRDPAPVFKVVGNPHKYIGPGEYYVTSHTPIYLNISDALAGNWTLHYRVWYNGEYTINETRNINETSDNIIITFEDNCTHYLEYYVENTTVASRYPKTGWDNETFYVDGQTPHIDKTYGHPTQVKDGKSYLTFDGTDDYVDCGTNTNLNFSSGAFTIELWMNSTAADDYNGGIGKYASDDGWQWYIRGSTYSRLRIDDSQVDLNLNAGNSYHDGAWHHIVITIEPGAVVKQYFDGELQDTTGDISAFPQNTTSNNPLIFGRYVSRFFEGNLSLVRIYNRALTETEIDNNYNGIVTSSGLISAWNMSSDYAHRLIDHQDDNDGYIYGAHRNLPHRYITSNTTVYLNATEQPAECASGNYTVYYRVWNETDWVGWKNGTTNNDVAFNLWTLNITTEGPHYIQYYATDELDNNGSEMCYLHNQTVYVDNTPPNITKEIGVPKYDHNITSDTPLYINISDNQSAPAAVDSVHVKVAIWNGTWNITWYNSTTSPLNKTIYLHEDCMHYVNITAYDGLGNAAYHNQTFYVDNSPPTITKEVGQPNLPAGNGDYYITNETDIWLNVTENRPCDIGGWTLNWKVWNATTDTLINENETHSNATINITEGCAHILGYYVNDSLGNRWPSAGWHNETFYVDKTKPNISKEYGHPLSEGSIGKNSDRAQMQYDDGTLRKFLEGDGTNPFPHDAQHLYNKDSTVDNLYAVNLSLTWIEHTNLTIEIWNYTSGGFPGAAQKVHSAIFELPGSHTYADYGEPEWIQMEFTTPISLDPNADYIINVSEHTGSAAWWGIDTNPYYIDSWVDGIRDSTTWDFAFITYNTTTGTYISSDTPIYLNETDIAVCDTPSTISYRIWSEDHGDWTNWEHSEEDIVFTLDELSAEYSWVNEECQHKIEYNITDAFGRKSGVKSQTFYVDRTAPSSTVAPISSPQNHVPFTISGQATDTGCRDGSGIDYVKLYYRFNNTAGGSWGAWKEYAIRAYDAPYQWDFYAPEEPNGSGYYQFRSIAVDKVGNTEPSKTTVEASCHVTAAPPIITKTVGDPKYPPAQSDPQYVSLDTPINLTASDPDGDDSTVAISYRIWNSTGWSDWNHTGKNMTEFQFEEECKHYLWYNATDGGGNQSIIHNQTYYVDDTPPTTTKEYGYPSQGRTALVLDGIDDYVEIGDLGTITNWTVQFWMRSEDVADYRNILHTNFPASGTSNIGVRFEQYSTGALKIGVSSDDTWRSNTVTPNLKPHTWYHVAAVGDTSSNTLRVYLNGTLTVEDTSHTSWPSSFDNVTIGKGFSNDAARHFQGTIDDVSIHRRVLSPDEIQSSYHGTLSTHDLISWWKMDTGQGTTIWDYWNSNNGINNGATWTHTYIQPYTTIYLNATDRGLTDECTVGSYTIYYRIWNETTTLTGWNTPGLNTNAEFTLADYGIIENCTHYIEYYAVDNLGNNETDIIPHNQTVHVDNAPPNVTKTIRQPFNNASPPQGTFYINSTSEIWLNVTENRSCDVGNWTLYWKVWNATTDMIINESQTHSNATITINESCEHILGYYAMDGLGNRYPSTGWHNQTFYVDNTPPASTKQYGHPNHTNSSGARWINFSTPIYLNASDAGCNGGVDNYTIYYRIWNVSDSWGPWQNSTRNASENIIINISEECEHQIQYYAIDGLGNNESGSGWTTVHTQTMYVDDTPPTTNVNAIVPYNQSQIPFLVTATASDSGCGDGSGIRDIELWYCYSSDNSTWSNWILYGTNNTDPYQWHFYAPEGAQYYQFYSIGTDNLGNREIAPAVNDSGCNVTVEPPVTTKTIGQPKYGTNDLWVTTDTPFNFTVNDPDGDNSKAHTYYRVWYNNDWYWDWTTYGSNFTLPGSDCIHYLEYYSIDEDGNEELVHNQTHYVDDTPPDIDITIGTPNEELADTVYYVTTDTDITLSAQDQGCMDGGVGLDTLSYKIKTGATWPTTWTTYSGPISFTEECRHDLRIRATDHLGNHNVTTYTFYVDETAPDIQTVIGSPSHEDSGDYYVTTTTPITIAANDQGCNDGAGLETLRYRRNSGSWTPISSGQTITLPASPCTNTVEIEATDRLGNKNTDTITFYVDTTPPDITTSVSSPKQSPSSNVYYVTTATTIDFSATDAGCNGGVGLYTLAYRIWTTDGWSSWSPYSTSISFSESCTHYLEINATDYLGNNRLINITFYVDITPPDTADLKEISGDSHDSGLWVTTDTDFSFEWTSDPDMGCNGGVGLDVIKYRIWYDDNADGSFADEPEPTWTEYTAGSSFSIAEPCHHKIEWYGTDLLGNEETPHEQEHYVDDTPPDTADLKEISGDSHDSGLWVTTDTDFSFEWTSDPDMGCNDGVGLKFIKYRIWYDDDADGSFTDEPTPSWTTYTQGSSFSIPEPCHHKIEWYGTDDLDNAETKNTFHVFVDNDAPQPSHSYGNPHYQDPDTLHHYITIDTPVYLDATDILQTPGTSQTDTSDDGTGTIMGIAPTTQTVYTHQTFTITVKIYPTQAVTGAQFTLNYNPSLLTLNGINTGDFFNANQGYQITQYDNASGTVTYAHALVNGASVTQQGTLATLTFTAKGTADTADLTLTDVVIGKPAGTAIPNPTINNGEVTIMQTCDVGLYYIYYNVKEGNSWTGWQRGDLNENIEIKPTMACEHQIQYYAEDILGHQSDIETVTFYVDDTQPSTTLEFGSPHHEINGKHYIQPTTPIYLNATDPGACAAGATEIYYGIYHPDTGWNNATTSIPQVTFTPDDYGITTECQHTLAFYAIDNLGLTEDTLQQTFYIDITPPSLTINQPQAGQQRSGVINITWDTSDTCDPAPTATVAYSNDSGSTWQPIASDITTTYYHWDTSTLPLGSEYHINITATDEAGNTHTETTGAFTIDNTNPVITNVSAIPNPQEIHHPVNISAHITDDIGLAEVALAITPPTGPTMQFSILSNATDHRYYTNRSFHQLGTYTYTVIVTDTSNNTVTSTGHQFTIHDTTPPEITNVTAMPTPQETGHHVNISAHITDNVAVHDVSLNITAPDGSTTNLSLTTSHTGDPYYLNQTYHQVGQYQFTLYATDTSDNRNHSAVHTFTIIITHLDVTPSSQYQYTGDPVTVNITLHPSQPVSGAQFNLTYNTSLLTAHTVSYGDLFGSSYYFQSGTIDATNGTITDVAAVSTAGPITTEGTLATITFTANDILGTTPLNLTNVIIGTPTGQPIHPIYTHNGTVTVANDTTPPQITKTIGDPSYSDHITSTTTITLTATDPGEYASGVHAIHYILDGEETVILSNTTQFTIPTEGTHTLEFWATDNIGNEGTHTTQTHHVDDTPPTITETYTGPNVDSYLNTNTTITLTATDPGSAPSGVAAIHYIITYPNNTTKEMTIPANTTTLSFTEPCNHTLEFWATDNLGHGSTHITRQYHVDTTSPSSAVAPISPYTQNLTTTLTITAADSGCANGAGLSTITLWYRYSPDNTSWDTWTAYTTLAAPTSVSFTAPNGSGYYQFYSTATDQLHNQETTPVTPDAIAAFVNQTVYTFQLSQGWNLISLPLQHNYTAETLGQAIPTCDAIARWDTITQAYVQHPVGAPGVNNFAIHNGVGYFVHVANNSTFTMAGEPVDNISVALEPGWNMIGYAKQQTLSADTISGSISGCDTLMKWDAGAQAFLPHPVSTPIKNFAVHTGMGLFLHTTQPTTWNGAPA